MNADATEAEEMSNDEEKQAAKKARGVSSE